MHRYVDGLSALNVALNLMIDEGDTLLVAAIAHPLHLVETRLVQKRSEAIGSRGPALPSGRRAE